MRVLLCLSAFAFWRFMRMCSCDFALLCLCVLVFVFFCLRLSVDVFACLCVSCLFVASCWFSVFRALVFVFSDFGFVFFFCSTSLPGGNQVDGLPPAFSKVTLRALSRRVNCFTWEYLAQTGPQDFGDFGCQTLIFHLK